MLLLLVYASSITFASAQWQHTNLPNAGRTVTCIATSGTNIFVGTGGISGGSGIFLSVDNGSTWIPVNNGLTDNNVLSLALNGTNIFAGTVNNGVFLSTNNGANWTAVNNGLPPANILSLAAIGTDIFAGSNGGNPIFFSTDTGATWTRDSIGPYGFGSHNAASLTVSGTNILEGTLGGYVFLSTNGGSTWSEIDNDVYSGLGAPVQALAMSGTNIFAGTSAGVFYLALPGPTWVAVNNGLLNTNVTSLAVSGTNIFAGTPGGIFLSTTTTGSSNWRAVNNGLADSAIFSLAISGANIFAGTDTAGVWKNSLSGILACLPVINALSSTDIFCGSSVTLSSSNGIGYFWSDGEVTQSIVVTEAGNYSCSVTTGCGKVTSNTISVNIIFNNDTIYASDTTTFCQGDSVTLTASASSANGYLWSDAETTKSIVVSTAGNYSCNVATNCGPVNTNSINVTVNQPPTAPTISPAGDSVTLCQGAMLTVPPCWFCPQISSYLWSNGATTSGIMISTPQMDSVTITDANGCTATSVPTNVTTVLPAPQPVITAGGPTTVCDGDSVVLNSNAATSYSWNNGDTTQSITTRSSDIYSVTVTNANGCSATSSPMDVTVYSNPIPPTIQQFDDSLKSSATKGNQWYFNSSMLPGDTDQYYVALQSGIYMVERTNDNGCSSFSAPFNFTYINVGIAELADDNSFSIYPNPVFNQLTIYFKTAPFRKTANISIMNVLGEEVLSSSLSGVYPDNFGREGRGEAVIDVSALPAGMYFLQMKAVGWTSNGLKTESGIESKRFVKE